MKKIYIWHDIKYLAVMSSYNKTEEILERLGHLAALRARKVLP